MRGPLRHPAFRWLLLGRTVNGYGNAVAPIALAFAVLDLTGSTSDLGIVVGTRSLTNVLLLLGGGVLADRLPRRLLLVVGSLVAGLTQATVAVLVLTGHASVWSLAVLGGVNGAAAGLSFPASAAVLPQTVPPGDLASTNALLSLSRNLISVVGVTTGALLVAVIGPGWGIAVDAGTFLLAGLAFSRLHLAPVERSAPGRSALTELREGWGEFRSRSWVWIIVVQFGIVNACLAGAEGVLGPVVADDTFGRKAYGLVLAAATIGTVVGAVVALRYQPRRALLFGTAAVLALGLPSFGLALFPDVAALCVVFFVSGVSVDQFGVAWDSSLQENVPPDRLARVYSYDALGSFVAIPVGEVLVGPLAVAFGVRSTLLGCGVLATVATVLALSAPSVRG